MTQFLLDTLLWTGVLIALVLVLRRPVARHFGPQAAYALWALPLLRLVTPPITLPAWMKPAEPAPEAESVVAMVEGPVAVADGFVARSLETAPATLPSPVDLVLPLLALWLLGAGVFLVRRFSLYFEMRRDLLADARPVGDAAQVRLVETPATLGPVAFGVRDKIIALPEGFMAQRDRQTRDLAIAHELAHHRGHDLLVNFLVQPLFALHWFNPLGWAGWRALRRDQEAACDARVVSERDRHERAAYAGIIAGFATTNGAAPRHALAAPMACPVLGDKSIIHRLRSLTMSDISPRRRFAGRALLAGAALALPLTASISYAETVQPEAPEAPSAPVVEQVAEAPPAPPAAPEAPQPPAAPKAPTEFEREIDIERVFEDVEKELERAEAKIESGEHRVVRFDRDGKHVERKVLYGKGRKLTAEERAELRREMAELRKEFAEDGELRRDIRLAIAEARNEAPKVVMNCGDGQKDIVREGKTNDGKEAIFVCRTAALETARLAIDSAYEAIKNDPYLSDEERSIALKSIKEAMAEHAKHKKKK